MSISTARPTVISMSAHEERHNAYVCIGGDVDLNAESQLTVLRQTLTKSGYAKIYVDLAAITFAGTTLLHFIEDLSRLLPANATVVLCRPNALLRQLLEFIDLDGMVSQQARLPDTWKHRCPVNRARSG
jgi:anti-anti-sigma regulatory factor